MTQAELAEPLMTKGMLSHVEKGKANLSMKNLKYIADKLNKPLSYFIDDQSAKTAEQIDSNSSIPYILINKELRDIDKMIRLNVKNAARDKLFKLIARYDLSSDVLINVEVIIRLARVQSLLSLFDDAKKNYKRVADMYNNIKLFNLSSLTLLELANMLLDNNREDEAIIELDSSRAVYDISPNVDVMYELNHISSMLIYHKSKCDLNKMIDLSKKSISLANEFQVFHRLSLPYSLNATMSMYELDEQSSFEAINILKSYGIIAHTKVDVVLADVLTARLHNSLGQFDKSNVYLSSIDNYDWDNFVSKHVKALYHFELGRLYIATGSCESATLEFRLCMDCLSDINNSCYSFIKSIVEVYMSITLAGNSHCDVSKKDAFSKVYATIDNLYNDFENDDSIKGVICRSESATLYKFLSYVLESLKDFEGAYNALTKANYFDKKI